MQFANEFLGVTFVTSLSTALLLHCRPEIAVIEALLASDAVLLVLALRTRLWSSLKEAFEAGGTPPKVSKALALARVILVVGSSTLAATVFSLSIFACLQEEQCMILKSKLNSSSLNLKQWSFKIRCRKNEVGKQTICYS